MTISALVRFLDLTLRAGCTRFSRINVAQRPTFDILTICRNFLRILRVHAYAFGAFRIVLDGMVQITYTYDRRVDM